MIVAIEFNWGESQPNWITNASQYARTKLGLYGDAERNWLHSTLGYVTHQNDEKISIIFEDDKDYTMAVLKWGSNNG